MRKIIQFLSFLLLQTVSVEAQRFGSSLGCNINVNDPIISMGTWRPCVDATFKYWKANGSTCTGKLIIKIISSNTEQFVGKVLITE
ncbi:MAG: hypothetical protein IT256_05070 [Chitinophagaceae bacterium]|nr:hypothetical protein [Chitinophagaceae bacterium]